jgi:hypothetical protein
MNISQILATTVLASSSLAAIASTTAAPKAPATTEPSRPKSECTQAFRDNIYMAGCNMGAPPSPNEGPVSSATGTRSSVEPTAQKSSHREPRR